MPCKICSHPETVNSHVIPKALALDVRGSDKHAIVAARKYNVGKPSQSGNINCNLLCDIHEKQTSIIDKYGIEFVRRIAKTWKAHQIAGSMPVDNPQPQLLRRFALLTIWRQVHTDETGNLTLSLYDKVIQNGLFGDSEFARLASYCAANQCLR